eukprot:TRINITY_DN7095_c0_g1_i1.p2 TRINITY_DN7095_c0_g1~~TRINITY_DN7095_c0_g1_i1.p2  ORF type:complete len:167 (+),score=16.82 TRINITY_DN7095_c0_g1_i1:108-608(+)
MKVKIAGDDVVQAQISMVLVVESVFGYCLNGGLVVLIVRLMYVSVVGGWSMAGDGSKGFIGFSSTLLGIATVLNLGSLYWCWRGFEPGHVITSFHRLSDTTTFARLLFIDCLIFLLQYMLILAKTPQPQRAHTPHNVPDAGPLHDPIADQRTPSFFSQSTLRRIAI